MPVKAVHYKGTGPPLHRLKNYFLTISDGECGLLPAYAYVIPTMNVTAACNTALSIPFCLLSYLIPYLSLPLRPLPGEPLLLLGDLGLPLHPEQEQYISHKNMRYTFPHMISYSSSVLLTLSFFLDASFLATRFLFRIF